MLNNTQVTHHLPSHNQQIQINIADLTIGLYSDDRHLSLTVGGATEKFLTQNATPDVSVIARWGHPLADPTGDRIFDSGGVWQLYRRERSYRFYFQSPPVGPLPYKIASFNSSFTHGSVCLDPRYFDSQEPVYPLEYPLDELLIVNLLAKGHGVELHGCGLLDSESNGHLFLGQSGAGKTTMARLWESKKNVQVLSDDRIILRQLDHRIWIYGTPWHGDAELSAPLRAPLSRIYFLLHGNENQLVPLTDAEAVARLFSCAFPCFYDPAALELMLKFFTETVDTVPCAELSFIPEETVVEFLIDRF